MNLNNNYKNQIDEITIGINWAPPVNDAKELESMDNSLGNACIANNKPNCYFLFDENTNKWNEYIPPDTVPTHDLIEYIKNMGK